MPILALKRLYGCIITLISRSVPKAFPKHAMFGNKMGSFWGLVEMKGYAFGNCLGKSWDILGRSLEDLELNLPNIRECFVNVMGVGWEHVGNAAM